MTVAVDQFRDGYASGTIVLQVTNTSVSGFTLVRAELSDPRFADGAVWTGSTRFEPGQTTSLPAVAASPRCAAPSTDDTPAAEDAAPSVRLRLADGTERLVRATDPHAVLGRIHTQGCFEATVASLVALRLDDTLEPSAEAETTVLTLRAGPPSAPATAGLSTGGPWGAGAPRRASVTLTSVEGTTLLAEDPAQPWPRGVVLAPGSTVKLSVRPARCDPHVVAEDKVGTLIPLRLEAGDSSGVVKAEASPALRAALYGFVGSACGWTGQRP